MSISKQIIILTQLVAVAVAAPVSCSDAGPWSCSFPSSACTNSYASCESLTSVNREIICSSPLVSALAAIGASPLTGENALSMSEAVSAVKTFCPVSCGECTAVSTPTESPPPPANIPKPPPNPPNPPPPPSSPPAPSAPPPPLPQISLTFTAAGDLSTFDSTEKSRLRDAIAAAASVLARFVTISVSAGSVIVTAIVEVPSGTAVVDVEQSMKTNLATTQAATSALGLTVETAPVIVQVTTGGGGGDDSDDLSGGVIAAIVVSAVLAVALVVVSVIYLKQRQGSQPEVELKKSQAAAAGQAPATPPAAAA